MKKPYTVVNKVIHDQEEFLAGSRIDLDDKQAQPLLDLGAVTSGYDGKEKAPEPADAGKTPVTLSDAEKLEAVKAVIGSLDIENTELWTKSGSPNATALGGLVGFDVSASLRDAAWNEVKPAA